MTSFVRRRPVLSAIAGIAGLLLLAYAVAGYWYAPRVIRSQAQQWVRANYKRELAVQSVRVNPFRLRLELKGIALPDADGSPMLGFSRLLVDAELSSLWRRKLVLRAVELDAPRVRALRRADGRLNLQDLVLPADDNAPPAQGSPLTSLWIQTLSINAGEAQFVDQMQTGASAPVRVGPLSLHTSALGIDLSQPQSLNVETLVNERAKLHVAGNLTLAPLAGTLQIGVQDLPLELLQPYALPGAALTIRSGTISTNGKLVIASTVDAAATLVYEGDVQLDSLHTVDNLLQEDLLNCTRLSLEKLRFSSVPAQLSIARVVVQEPYARLVISPKKITNISAVLQPPAAAASPAAKPQPAAPPRATATPTDSTAPRSDDAFVVRIDEVAVQGGRLSFADLNIQPNFAAEISALEGRVAPVTSARDALATVQLAGKVGEFSPVKIEGTLQPFAFDRQTRIRLDFSNIALPVFNPYSGAFAGFNIAKGKLDTQLSYEIDNRRLKAAHHVRIDQLEWGEASKYKGEATLPVKFATVLLRDRHGVIDLDLPVSGSLDDPKFRVGALIWQVLRNVIVKAATAPFAALGSLFAGAEQAQYVAFAPGLATLDAEAAGQLQALARGLAEREGLAVDIPLAVIDELDRPALLEQRVRTLMQQQQVPAEQAAAAEQQLRATTTVSDADLEALAQSRGEAVQRALLATGELQPARVFIVRDGKFSADDGRVRLELNLK